MSLVVGILKNLYMDESSKDVTLMVKGDERQIRAHRLILMGASDYFRKLFTADFQEKDQEVVTLQGLKFETLRMIITYLYSDQLRLPENCSLKEAFLAADYLMVDCAKKRLNAYVLDNNNNFQMQAMWDMLFIEDKVSKEVLEKAMKQIEPNISINRKYITGMPFQSFLAFLKYYPYGKVSYHVPGTVKMLTEIVHWVREVPVRHKLLFKLLSAVSYVEKVEMKFIMEELFPLCQGEPDSLSFLIALIGRQCGYNGTTTKKYLGDNYTAGTVFRY